MNTFTVVFLAALALSLALHAWLALRQLRHLRAGAGDSDDTWQQMEPAKRHQAVDYTLAKTRFSLLERLGAALVLLIWTLGGGLALLDEAWRSLELGPLATGTGFLVTLALLVALLELPFEAYRIFGLEQRFGFNRRSMGLFFADTAKQLTMTALLGLPLAALVLAIMHAAGPLWWFYVWLAWLGFTVLAIWAFPVFVAPLFNDFRPLQDEGLRRRIETLLQRCGFAAEGVFVADGSRRSTHGNAYFSGLGRNKRVVFFDTLLAALEPAEIEAVLAHELGHYKRRHLHRRLLWTAMLGLAGLLVLAWLSVQSGYYAGLGVEHASPHTALALFLLVAPAFGFLVHPLTTYGLRKQEFEADEFAAQAADAQALVQALLKLYRDNAVVPSPDPLYSAYHDSHPPASVRVRHLLARIAG